MAAVREMKINFRKYLKFVQLDNFFILAWVIKILFQIKWILVVQNVSYFLQYLHKF